MIEGLEVVYSCRGRYIERPAGIPYGGVFVIGVKAGERVRTAIKNSGFEYPAKRTVVNLSPATMRKHGVFDLPIAAILAIRTD